jgi:hypothetical protein
MPHAAAKMAIIGDRTLFEVLRVRRTKDRRADRHKDNRLTYHASRLIENERDGQ